LATSASEIHSPMSGSCVATGYRTGVHESAAPVAMAAWIAEFATTVFEKKAPARRAAATTAPA